MASFDVYQTVTDKIVAALESAQKWNKPWLAAFDGGNGLVRPVNATTGKGYRGINVPILWTAGRESNSWATYKQWNGAGAQVRKGEKGTQIVVWKTWTPADGAAPAGDEPGKPAPRLFARAYTVFNSEQVDGWEAAPAPVAGPAFDPIAAAESFVASTGADIRHGGGRAFYTPSHDFIQMPERAKFVGTPTSTAAESYYGTMLHELVHWTGKAERCNRDFSGRFGTEAYAFEELVAELGAAFLSADLLVRSDPRPDHAQYIKSWLEVLKGDKRAVFTAASKAEQAAGFLAALQPGALDSQPEPIAIAA